MEEPDRIANVFTAVVWIGCGLLLWAGVSWLGLYKSIAKMRRREGGTGIDSGLLQEAALLTGLGMIATVAGFGLQALG